MTNYFFNERRRPIDNETFLMTDFVNLKISQNQSRLSFSEMSIKVGYMCVCSYE
jgi:hypothetical protein